MNMIEKALMEVRNRIPREILEITFQNRLHGKTITYFYRYANKRKVMNARVMVDCNIAGGEQILIKLDGFLHNGVKPPYSAVYNVSKSLTRENL